MRDWSKLFFYIEICGEVFYIVIFNTFLYQIMTPSDILG